MLHCTESNKHYLFHYKLKRIQFFLINVFFSLSLSNYGVTNVKRIILSLKMDTFWLTTEYPIR